MNCGNLRLILLKWNVVFNIFGENKLIIIIIYSIYRALIPKGPKALYIIENNNKVLNLQNYIIIL